MVKETCRVEQKREPNEKEKKKETNGIIVTDFFDIGNIIVYNLITPFIVVRNEFIYSNYVFFLPPFI